MKPLLKISGMAAIFVVLLVPEVIQAQAGRMHRATRRRTAVVAHSATKAHDRQAMAAQQQATAEQQAATAAQQSATAEQQSATARAVPRLPFSAVVLMPNDSLPRAAARDRESDARDSCCERERSVFCMASSRSRSPRSSVLGCARRAAH